MAATEKRPQSGWHHSEETKRKISILTQEARAKAREGGIPSQRRCAKCLKWKKAKEFSWRKIKLVSGETHYILYPRCKKCESERMAEYRERVGVKEMRRRYKKHHVARKRRRKREKEMSKRVPKGPFCEWFLETKAKYRRTFSHEEKPAEEFAMPLDRNTMVEKARFDRAAFCTWLGITVQEYETIMRLASPSSETTTIRLELVDRILTKTGRADLLQQLTTRS